MLKNNRISYIKPYKGVPILEVNSIELKQLPKKPDNKKFDIIPSLVTVGISLIMAIFFYYLSGSFPVYILLFPITMLVLPLITHWRSKKELNENYLKAVEKYDSYLTEINNQWNMKNQELLIYYNNNFPESSAVKELVYDSIIQRGKYLWSFIPEHKEFMSFRIGTFNRVSPIKLVGLNQDEDDIPKVLLDKINDITLENNIILESPLIVDLKKNPFIAIRGQSLTKCFNRLNAPLLNLFSSHAYDDVKLAVLGNEENYSNSAWLRWLPHNWDNQGRFRYYCVDENTTDFLDHLEKIIEIRLEKNINNQYYPEYVIIIENLDAFFSHTISRFFTSTTTQIGIRIIFVLSDEKTIPSICSLVIDVDQNKYFENILQHGIDFCPDELDIKIAEEVTRTLSNVDLVNGDRTNKLPEIITFYDLLKNDALRLSTLENVWNNNHAYKKGVGLRVPIGIRADGSLIYIDLKDGADGPHAIIAGMTGSGKTELLQTLILSLTINYSPEQVSFAFIDFKEGGMANQFIGIPHESGILTNEGNNVVYLANRAITMLQQEKKYRGELLKKYGLDIDRYHQKFYSEDNRDMEALPHLFVIIDESAEVVDQFHDFMSEMVSIARVGRSMGIHLILSTQNPSRTVDNQIFDNANMKICLSVLSEEESKAILKTNEAAYIVNRGRAFLLTGNGKRYEEFQSAYSGAEASSNSENLGTEPIVISNDGNLIQLIKNETKDIQYTQLDEIINVLRSLASHSLEHEVFSNTLESTYHLYDADVSSIKQVNEIDFGALIGKLDVLETQAIKDAVVNFDLCRNIIIYGSPRSGKTTLTESILFDLIQRYSQDRLQCIIVSTGAGTLSRLSNHSFISEVVTDVDFEKLYRLPTVLISETRKRIKHIKELGYHSIIDYEKNVSEPRFPRTVVFIDSLQYYKFASKFSELFSAGSAQAGIHVVATYQDSALPRDLIPHFGCQIALQIHDDLSFRYNISYRSLIEKLEGRGIYSDNTNEFLELQAFKPSLTTSFAKGASEESFSIIKQPYNINNGSVKYLNKVIQPAKTKFCIKTSKDALEKLEATSHKLPLGIYYESLDEFSISSKSKACLFSILGDKQTRIDLKFYLEENLRKIGKVIYYGEEKPIPDKTDLKKDFDNAIMNGEHLFVLICYEKQDFINFPNENQKYLIQLLETIYRGKATLIVVTSARMAKIYAPINEFCINSNSIIAIGGKHDAHVRFADVSTKIIDIPLGEAYVSTTSTRFERLILKS